jgi:hypothetical protein
MKNYSTKKIFVIGAIAILLSIYVTPSISNEDIKEQINDEKVTIKCIDFDSSTIVKKYTISEEESSNLKIKLSSLFNILKTINNKDGLMDELISLFDDNDNSFINNIIMDLLNTEILDNRKLIVSQGWGYNLNLFKRSSTDIIKPFTIWRYTDQSNQLFIPSGSAIVSLNPFEIKTFVGAQIGFMFRFRGLYIHVARPIQQKSYTFFIGTAGQAGGFELTPLSSILGLN